MKIWKKTLALLLAFGMVMSITACGGSKDGGNNGNGNGGGNGDANSTQQEPVGEELAGESGWATAWENTLTATNAHFEISYSYYYSDSMGWISANQVGYANLADSKIYMYADGTYEWDHTEDGVGSSADTVNSYYGYENGLPYEWFYDVESSKWIKKAGLDGADFSTCYGVVDIIFEFDRYEYLEWESIATYADGFYSATYGNTTYKFKFDNQKLYSFETKMIGEGETESYKITISYGNAEVGDLPEAGGNVGGDEGDDIQGEELPENGWAAAWENTFTATNVTGEGLYVLDVCATENAWMKVTSVGYLTLAENKMFSVGSVTIESDYSDMGEEPSTISMDVQTLRGMKDGKLYEWDYEKNLNTWIETESEYESEYFGTLYCVIEMEFEGAIGRYDYLEWESRVTYEDGVYTLVNEGVGTYQFKFVDGKLYTLTFVHESFDNAGTRMIEQSYVFQYGNGDASVFPSV